MGDVPCRGAKGVDESEMKLSGGIAKVEQGQRCPSEVFVEDEGQEDVSEVSDKGLISVFAVEGNSRTLKHIFEIIMEEGWDVK